MWKSTTPLWVVPLKDGVSSANAVFAQTRLKCEIKLFYYISQNIFVLHLGG
jgi:hypothetical protein